MSVIRFRLYPYRLLPRVDWILILLALILGSLGIMTIWGATATEHGRGPFGGYALKQSIWFAAGIGMLVFLTVFDYRRLHRVIWLLYVIALGMLMGLLLKGHTIKGAASWYSFGPFHLEPAEPAKVIVVLTLAHYLSQRIGRFRGIHHTIVPWMITGVPMLLILAQRALGSALVIIPITFSMFWVAGIRKLPLILFVLGGAGMAFLAYPHLKPYQQERIRTFINPDADPRGKGWNIIQATTTLGSGELLGKGWGHGTQSCFHFLPESHTDFIFPTVGEQFGFVGCIVVISLFLLLVVRLLHSAGRTHDMFGVLTVTGLAAMLGAHCFMNIGMVVGLLPVAGLPLPFFSYGGSFMLACMTVIGLTVGIVARRDL